MIANALDRLGNYERCIVFVRETEYECFWSTHLECWFCVGPAGLCYLFPEHVEEWMPAGFHPRRSETR